jgi:hypothetical protein
MPICDDAYLLNATSWFSTPMTPSPYITAASEHGTPGESRSHMTHAQTTTVPVARNCRGILHLIAVHQFIHWTSETGPSQAVTGTHVYLQLVHVKLDHGKYVLLNLPNSGPQPGRASHGYVGLTKVHGSRAPCEALAHVPRCQY